MNMPLTMGNSHGRPAMFQGRSPGVSGSAGRGAFPFGPMNPRPVNQTMGWQTNYTINYAFVCRRFKTGSDESLRAGQVVFGRRKERDVLGDPRLATLCNVVQLNFLMRKMAKKSNAHPQYRKNDHASMRKIIKEWFPLGIVCNEVGGSHEDQPQERLLNVCIRGRTSASNMWGQSAICDGTRLWVVLYWQKSNDDKKGGALGPTFRTRLNQVVDDRIKLTQADGDGGCWQFACWADQKLVHPIIGGAGSFREQWGLEAGTKIWPVCLGRVSSKGYLHSFATKDHTQGAHRDVDKHTTLPQFEIFVDPDLEFPWVASKED
jgi:hypothetical protein